MLRPVAVAAVVAAATGRLALVDPAQPGHYPGCPFLALTGRFCPGCGGLRAVHHLAHGDVVAALSSNLLVVLAVPVLVVLWFRWVARVSRRDSVNGRLPSVSGPDPKGRVRDGNRIWTPVLLAIGLILFAVLRNIPALQVLAP
ncbi:DUF2752 domain-containing protein [Kineosporia sp. J2-2]|uniref:DUF2752 domain-containing protein n=1 Tax=Kineosporia corallincola TaxID=2835133 RepID=A0ABS5TCX3_9ACTN|nr:DUF2752 domain-containing protein [Kineosporia corallincola]MBT0768891.1 DUF2752 domain-containing protein [Kineosporia corallincola]